MSNGDGCCKCKYFRKLKHNFKLGEGFEVSNCCIILGYDYNGEVLEVNDNELCECFSKKGNNDES